MKVYSLIELLLDDIGIGLAYWRKVMREYIRDGTAFEYFFPLLAWTVG